MYSEIALEKTNLQQQPPENQLQSEANALREKSEKQLAKMPAPVRSPESFVPGEIVIASAFKAGHLDRASWLPHNKTQEYIINGLPDAYEDLKNGLPPSIKIEAKANSNGDPTEINKLMRDHHLNIPPLQPGNPNQVFMGAVMELQGPWAGTPTSLQEDDGKTVKAVQVENTQTYEVNGQDVVSLYSKDGVAVYATSVPDGKNLSGLEAEQLAKSMTPDGQSTWKEGYTRAVIPEVDKTIYNELPSLRGMTTTDGKTIEQVKAALHLKVDKNGFSATEGVVAQVSRGVEHTVELKGKLLIWAVNTDGKSKDPLFATELNGKDYTPAQ